MVGRTVSSEKQRQLAGETVQNPITLVSLQSRNVVQTGS